MSCWLAAGQNHAAALLHAHGALASDCSDTWVEVAPQPGRAAGRHVSALQQLHARAHAHASWGGRVATGASLAGAGRRLCTLLRLCATRRKP